MPQAQPPSPPDEKDSPAGDHLAQLHKMSTTAGVTNQGYVAVNQTAVVALFLGVASALALLGYLLLVIPVVGIIFGITALRQIKDSAGTQTGTWLAMGGLILSILLGGGEVAKEVLDRVSKRGDEQKIAATIDEVGKFIRAGDFDKAHALFDDAFRKRVTVAQFKATWLAVQAPTASNSQTWRWMIVTDPDLRRKVADLYREEAMPYLEGSLTEAEAAGGQDERVFKSALYLAENMERAPVLVIPCLAEDLAGQDTNRTIVALGSVCQAAWSFQLALRARGLGSTWTTLHLRRAAEVAGLLGIPAGVTQVSLIPVAYTKGTDFKPAKRSPVSEITYWDRWAE